MNNLNQKDCILPYSDTSISSGNKNNFIGVSSSYKEATEAGLKCMQNGGNAIDALVTTSIAITVTEPALSGALGCGLAMISEPYEKTEVLNFSGATPEKFNFEDFINTTSSDNDWGNPKTTFTPTIIHAWQQLLDKYGSITLKQAISPSIDLANKGIKITEDHLFYINIAKNRGFKLSSEIYDNIKKPGDLLIQKSMAKTLELISKKGPKVIEQGEIHDAIISEIQNKKGFLNKSDLIRIKNNNTWEKPISINFFGYTIETTGPNSDAFSILQMLKIYENLHNKNKIKNIEHNSSEYIHTIAEIIKKATYDLKFHGGDPKYSDITSYKKLLDNIDFDINQEITNYSNLNSNIEKKPGGTSTIVSVDKSGLSAIMTQTLGGVYGNGIEIQDHGIHLNGIGSFFIDKDTKVKARMPIPKSKVPWCVGLISIRKNGELLYQLGTPGGFVIPQALFQTILNIILFDMNIDQAIDAPKFDVDQANGLRLEKRIDKKTISQLSSQKYKLDIVGDFSWRMGNTQGVSHINNKIQIVGDRRRHSVSKGYNI